jgi:outer membrane protein OmpA-like peptidoglycan-associated protein
MDLTVDVLQIPVEPEYPVAETHTTETFFRNQRRVQLMEEVQTANLSVNEFLAQVESVRAAEMAEPISTPEENRIGDRKVVNKPNVAGNKRVIKNERPAIDVDPSDLMIRPHSDYKLVPGVDIFTVYFPKGIAELDHIDRQVIERLPQDQCYRVAGFSSPEGSKWFNYDLSVNRATAVSVAIEQSGRRVLAGGGLGEFSAKIWPHPWPIERRVEIYPEDCPSENSED